MGKLAPEHVSVYLLEVDEGSRLGLEILQSGKRYWAGAVPSDDEMAEFYETACAFLEERGYHHYEISNWARPGFESKHNLKYWRREAYLGFGAGAHSFSGTQRWANAHDAAAYVEAITAGGCRWNNWRRLRERVLWKRSCFWGCGSWMGLIWGGLRGSTGLGLSDRFERLEAAGFVERKGKWCGWRRRN